MVLEILAGAALLAFGVFLIYFSVEGGEKNTRFLVYLLIGIAAILGGGWIIITRITLAVLLTKVAGFVLAVIGFFLLVQFPDITEYQKEGTGKAGLLIGLFLLIAGGYLLFFG